MYSKKVNLRQTIIHVSVTISVFAILAFLSLTTHAQAPVTYPIAELGNCVDAQACQSYCDVPQHHATCWSYQKYTMQSSVLGESTASQDDLEAMAKGITFPIPSLGDCTDVNQCKSYCDNTEHQKSCRQFAKSHELPYLDEGTLALLELAPDALGCETAAECEDYCDQNIDSCIEFVKNNDAEKYQLLYQEYDQMIAQAVESLGCQDRASCEQFCDKPENRTQCIEFIDQHATSTFIDQRNNLLEIAQTELGCEDAETCQQHCESEENLEQCQQFVETHISPQESTQDDISGSCETEEECRVECGENPELCPGYEESEESEFFNAEVSATVTVTESAEVVEENSSSENEADPETVEESEDY